VMRIDDLHACLYPGAARCLTKDTDYVPYVSE